MAVLKYKDTLKMSEKEREEKLRDLRSELVKANVAANRASAKTKEIKKAISRILTIQTLNKSKNLLRKK